MTNQPNAVTKEELLDLVDGEISGLSNVEGDGPLVRNCDSDAIIRYRADRIEKLKVIRALISSAPDAKQGGEEERPAPPVAPDELYDNAVGPNGLLGPVGIKKSAAPTSVSREGG